MTKSEFPKIGLALGGGAALGWAHIGIIRVLQKRKVPLHCVCGTSIGAMVGGCHAAGKLNELEGIARGLTWTKMMALADVQIAKNGFLGGTKVVKELEAHLAEIDIEDLDLPFAAVAVDLIQGQEVVLQSGNLVEAIRASISLPGIFSPVEADAQLLVDGGLMNTVPVSLCRELGAEFVIGVNVVGDYLDKAESAGLLETDEPMVLDSAEREEAEHAKSVASTLAAWKGGALGAMRRRKSNLGFTGIGLASMALVMRELARGQLERCPPDMLLEPKVGHIMGVEFNRAEELIEIGTKCAEDGVPANPEAFSRNTGTDH